MDLDTKELALKMKKAIKFHLEQYLTASIYARANLEKTHEARRLVARILPNESSSQVQREGFRATVGLINAGEHLLAKKEKYLSKEFLDGKNSQPHCFSSRSSLNYIIETEEIMFKPLKDEFYCVLLQFAILNDMKYVVLRNLMALYESVNEQYIEKEHATWSVPGRVSDIVYFEKNLMEKIEHAIWKDGFCKIEACDASGMEFPLFYDDFFDDYYSIKTVAQKNQDTHYFKNKVAFIGGTDQNKVLGAQTFFLSENLCSMSEKTGFHKSLLKLLGKDIFKGLPENHYSAILKQSNLDVSSKLYDECKTGLITLDSQIAKYIATIIEFDHKNNLQPIQKNTYSEMRRYNAIDQEPETYEHTEEPKHYYSYDLHVSIKKDKKRLYYMKATTQTIQEYFKEINLVSTWNGLSKDGTEEQESTMENRFKKRSKLIEKGFITSSDFNFEESREKRLKKTFKEQLQRMIESSGLNKKNHDEYSDKDLEKLDELEEAAATYALKIEKKYKPKDIIEIIKTQNYKISQSQHTPDISTNTFIPMCII